jgi:hypothetical protein
LGGDYKEKGRGSRKNRKQERYERDKPDRSTKVCSPYGALCLPVSLSLNYYIFLRKIKPLPY